MDICGGALSKVNLRVHVVDVDSITTNDNLSNFNCLFDIPPRDIATNAQSAEWGPSNTWTPTPTNDKIRLFTRMRVYQIPASDCRVDDNLSPQATITGAGDRFRDGTSSSAVANLRATGQNEFIRIDVELVQLLNPQGVAQTGKPCDPTGACDPFITAYLDADKPLASWPGPKTLPEFTKVFKASNTNSPIINKNITKTICGGSVNKLNLRVHVMDSDTLSHNDPIGDFACVFAVNYRLVAPDISSSDWMPTQDCIALNQKNDIRLQYRYRVYDIPQSECGIQFTPKNQ
ncbi:hypothetical protein BV898_02444 [Hypsibius exemplaris]|uniref:C2 domain-containing protein n=1 Tax=Hypsibius exemplaris TaxID=2072580 RepID=A0A1W0X8I3_HYPEX|nr:hypothetical protein BV898_02444 [Hypsibius exemplaris]